MIKTVAHKGKTYLKVKSAKKRSCDGCALNLISISCPRTVQGGLFCTANGVDDTNYILIENTPEARAEHFARKVK